MNTKKEAYLPPVVYVEEIMVEKGIAVSSGHNVDQFQEGYVEDDVWS